MLKPIALLTLMTLPNLHASEIQISAYANSGQIALIKGDLEYLKSIQVDAQTSPFLIKTMQLKNNETLYDWLNTRVKYIIEEDFFDKSGFLRPYPLVKEKKNIKYPNPDIFPNAVEDLLGDFLGVPQLNTSANNSTMTIMTNVGTSLYIQGKAKKELLSIRFTEKKSLFKKRVLINSPRIGIIQIGAGLFMPDVRPNPLFANALSNKLHRIATFLHEARHSDGNGKTLGFIHHKCPEGHNYAGTNSCDISTNGPYIIGAQATVDAIKWCGNECSPSEKTMLKVMALDSFSRIIPLPKGNKSETVWDANPEYIH